MVVQLLWLSGRALAAYARGVLGLTPGDCRLFTFLHFRLITSKFIYEFDSVCFHCTCVEEARETKCKRQQSLDTLGFRYFVCGQYTCNHHKEKLITWKHLMYHVDDINIQKHSYMFSSPNDTCVAMPTIRSL